MIASQEVLCSFGSDSKQQGGKRPMDDPLHNVYRVSL